jgi:hypothetical protein
MQGWVGQNIQISADGRQLMTEDNFNLHIYQQAGSESKWGVIATWQFWLLVASVAALVISLWRDARCTRQRWGRTTPLSRRRTILAIALVAAGGIAMISPLVSLSGHHGYGWNLLGLHTLFNDVTQWWTTGGWLVAIFAFYLFAGLGLVMGGRAWELVVGVMLLASIVIELRLVSQVGEFAEHPQMIYDRAWMLSPTWMAAAQVGWAVCALAALVARLWDRRVAPVARGVA